MAESQGSTSFFNSSALISPISEVQTSLVFVFRMCFSFQSMPKNSIFYVCLVCWCMRLLALGITSDCEKTHNLSNKYSKKLVRKMRKLYFYICNTSKEFPAISYKLVVWKTRLQLIIRFGLLRLGTHLTRERLGFCKTVLLRLQNLIFKPLKF